MMEEEDTDLVPIELAQEYSTKLLGFPPLQVSDDIYNVLLDNLGLMIDSFGEKILDKYSPKLLPNNVTKLTTYLKYKLQNQQNNLFDSFDAYLVGDILRLDSAVILNDDKIQLAYSMEREKVVRERIATCINRIIVLNDYLSLVKDEKTGIKANLKSLSNLRERIDQILKDYYSAPTAEQLCLRIYRRNNSVNRICVALSNQNSVFVSRHHQETQLN